MHSAEKVPRKAVLRRQKYYSGLSQTFYIGRTSKLIFHIAGNLIYENVYRPEKN
jgi:hypothetical protein